MLIPPYEFEKITSLIEVDILTIDNALQSLLYEDVQNQS
jgi:hypothetical protein